LNCKEISANRRAPGSEQGIDKRESVRQQGRKIIPSRRKERGSKGEQGIREAERRLEQTGPRV
jgi:hypothetical protein